jgi:pimeloyl-ACP methyl ester carboxylesterase
MADRTITGFGGVQLAVHEAGEGPLVVLCHGFPELARSWRHQLPALAAAGYHAAAADGRGYGESGCPDEVTMYDIDHLCGDQLAVLDAMGAESAVFVGHDWGAMVVWALAQRAPERVRGVVGMSVPFTPRPPAPPTAIFRHVFTDTWFYMLYFQAPGVADADLGRDPATTMRRFLAGIAGDLDEAEAVARLARDDRGMVERLPEPEQLPAWLPQDELDAYVDAFARTGFTGALNWYRNMDRNWELSAAFDGKGIDVPSLFIGGTHDVVLRMMSPEAAEPWLHDHRGNVLVEGAGHWVQQERPDVVNDALLRFLADLG